MKEEEARAWLETELAVPRETLSQLEYFLNLVLAENERQNLISKGSIAEAWSRHIVDSAQLLKHVPPAAGAWLDLGTGAGFPGMVIALLRSGPITLVEERRLRAEFLNAAAAELGIADRTRVICSKLERIAPSTYDVISARAFAPLEKLLTISLPFSNQHTRWILPKGRNARLELEDARTSWQGEFRLEPSVTDDEAGIIIADAVAARARKRGGR